MLQGICEVSQYTQINSVNVKDLKLLWMNEKVTLHIMPSRGFCIINWGKSVNT